MPTAKIMVPLLVAEVIFDLGQIDEFALQGVTLQGNAGYQSQHVAAPGGMTGRRFRVTVEALDITRHLEGEDS